jgi:hypothetical protein
MNALGIFTLVGAYTPYSLLKNGEQIALKIRKLVEYNSYVNE